MTHAHDPAPAGHPETVAFWQQHYAQRDQIWSGNANPVLVAEATPLAPGRALDLGCGEGADAIWLASRGWRVTAVDVSTIALRRARAAAEAAGAAIAELIDWQQHDLSLSFPAGEFDLVSAQFLHSPVELPREEILRSAAAAVAPGGVLLIVGHAEFPPWVGEHRPELRFVTPAEVLASLELAAEQWQTISCENRARPVTAPDGSPATLVDGVVLARRANARGASAALPAGAGS